MESVCSIQLGHTAVFTFPSDPAIRHRPLHLALPVYAQSIPIVAAPKFTLQVKWKFEQAGKMVRQVKALATKPVDLSRIPRIHMVEGENEL